jgi:two-component system, cell cycle sensor histidine kinase and response regulator CckA
MADLPSVAQRYDRALRAFVASRKEAALQTAYELGREAIAAGWGVLDLLRIHEDAVAPLLNEYAGRGEDVAEVARAGGAFLSESLAPFEMTHRGFQEAYATLRQSEARYRSLVENAPYGICRCGPDGRFVSANPALVRMLGYESETELLAVNPGVAVHREPNPMEYHQLLSELLHHGEGSRVADVQWSRKDGTPLPVRLSARAIIGTSGSFDGVELMAEDVTEQRVLEQRLRLAQKMEAIGRLAGGIAHDFNNFITGITLCNHIMGRGLAADDPRRRQVEEIDLAATRAALLTQQLLAFARRQVLQPRALDVNEVVASMTKLLRPLLGADVELATDLAPEPCTVQADPGQLEQMIMNLAVNARDAMPEGGALTIATRTVAAMPGGAEPPEPSGRWVALAVTDTGVGMDATTQARIFEPFFTTKETGRGTGLGLSTVYGIATQSGGQVHVRSAPSAGSTFTVYLPHVATSGDTSDSTEHGSIEAVGGGGTILAAEDDEIVRDGIRQTLEAAGYTVLVAPSGEAALERAREPAGNTIELLITDLVMPGMGGRALAEHFLLLQPQGRVLYISGYLGDAMARRSLSIPDHQLLQKPFSADALTKKVAEMLRDRPTPSGSRAT